MKLRIAISALLVIVIAIIVFAVYNGPASPNVSYPFPNAYDRLVEASEKMSPLPMDFDTSQDTEALRSYLDSNADALALIDQAADQQCLIRLADMQTMEEMHENASFARGPARLMYVKGRLAEPDESSSVRGALD